VIVVGGLAFLLWPLFLTLRGQGGAMVWMFGLGMGLRLSSILLGGMLLLLTTRTEEILAAFSRLGLPYPAVFSLGLTFRLVPALLANAKNVVEAQRLRGLRFDEGGLVTRTRRYIPLLVPILATSLRSAHRMSWALEAKGFGSTVVRSPFIVLRMRAADYLVLALGVAVLTAAVIARLAGVGVLPFNPA
jgi:energy-coupling factor transport system permease protein